MGPRRDDESPAVTVEVMKSARRVVQLVSIGTVTNVLDPDTHGIPKGVCVVENELDGRFLRGPSSRVR